MSNIMASNDVVLEFIERYRNEQILWDPKHPHYKNKPEVRAAWERIQSGMSIEVSILDLKRKKESLMSSYRMHHRRTHAVRKHEYKPSWFAYSIMDSFLGDVYVADEQQAAREHFTVPTSEHQYTPNISVDRKPTTPYRKSRYPQKSQTPETYNTSLNTSSNYNDRTEMDECELYGQLLAKKLRRLNENQRDFAMHEIDNIIFRLKMNNGSSQVPQSSGYSGQRKKSPIFIVAQPQLEQYDDESINYQQTDDPIHEEET